MPSSDGALAGAYAGCRSGLKRTAPVGDGWRSAAAGLREGGGLVVLGLVVRQSERVRRVAVDVLDRVACVDER